MIGDLSGKVAVVTGAGQGIGEGIARLFAKAGAKIVVATRTAANGQETVNAILSDGGEAALIQTDVGAHNAVDEMVAATAAKYGRLDIMVHNAAVYPLYSIEDLPDDALDQTLSVNLKAAF